MAEDRLYRVVVRAALGLFRLLGLRFDVRGEEHVPPSGAAVLAANHQSFLDFMVVGLNSDASMREIKGPTRPIIPEGERAEEVDE